MTKGCHGEWTLGAGMFLAAAVTFAVFSCSFGYGLCGIDDSIYLEAKSIWSVVDSTWMPLTQLSYAVDRFLGWGYHVQGVLWHSVNAAILFCVLFVLSGRRVWVALLAALVWAVHPLRVESVVWVASRKDVLSTFFVLSALLFWVSGRRTALSFVLVAVGFLAKPSVIVFPVFAVAADFCVLRSRKSWEWYGLLAGEALVLAVIGWWIQSKSGTAMSKIYPLDFRIANMLAALSIYVRNICWPKDLAVQCMVRYPDPPLFSSFGVAVLVLLGLAGVRRCKALAEAVRSGRDIPDRLLWLGVLTLVCLVPFLAGFGYHAFADRFTILPAVVLSMLVVAAIGEVAASSPHRARAMMCAGAAVVVALGWRTVWQTRLWEDNERLYAHTLEVDRDNNVCIQRTMGLDYLDREDWARAYEHYKKAYEYAWHESIKDYVLMDGCWIADMAYRLGLNDEGEDWTCLMRKWNYRNTPDGGKRPEYLFCEVLTGIHSGREAGLREARETFARFRREIPDSPLTKRLEEVFREKKML